MCFTTELLYATVGAVAIWLAVLAVLLWRGSSASYSKAGQHSILKRAMCWPLIVSTTLPGSVITTEKQDTLSAARNVTISAANARYGALSAGQDEALRQACTNLNSATCRGLVNEAVSGSATQQTLVATGALPANYLGGADFNSNVRLFAQKIQAQDVVNACAANPAQCDQARLAGSVRLLMTATVIAASAAAVTVLGAEAAALAAFARNPVLYCTHSPTACMAGVELALCAAAGPACPPGTLVPTASQLATVKQVVADTEAAAAGRVGAVNASGGSAAAGGVRIAGAAGGNGANSAAQTNLLARLAQDGHALERHGGGVTDQQLLTRAMTAVAPDGSSVVRNGQTVIPPSSTAFHSDALLAQSDQFIRQNYLDRAIALSPPGAQRVTVEGVDMGINIGRGFDRVSSAPGAAGPLQFNSNLSRATAVYSYDAASGIWRTVTIYPVK